MSLRAITWAWEQDEITEQTDLLVLLAIADHADEHARCFPSQGLLARKARCSTDTVSRALKRLEAARFISRTARPGTGSGRTSDLYQLHLDRTPVNVSPTGTSPSGQTRKMRSCQKDESGHGDNHGKTPREAGGNTAECGGGKPAKEGGANPHSCAAGTLKEPPEPSLPIFDQGSAAGDIPESAKAARAAESAPRGSAKRTASGPQCSIDIRSGTSEYAAWVEHLNKAGRADLIADPLAVPRRWPQAGDLPWPRRRPPAPKSPVSAKMAASGG